MAEDWSCGARGNPKPFIIKMEVEPLEEQETESAEKARTSNNVNLHTDWGGTSEQQVNLQDVIIKTEETEQLDCDTEMQTFIDEEAMEFSRISGGRSQANGDASNLDHDDVIKQNVPSKEDGYEKALKQITQPPSTRYKCNICGSFRPTSMSHLLQHNNEDHSSKHIMYMAQTDSNVTEITTMAINSHGTSNYHRILLFRCSGCEKIFKTRDTLVEHIQTENACGAPVIPDVFFCCRYCDTSFLTEIDLTMHDCTNIVYCPCGQCGNPDIMKVHWTECKQLASTESYCPCTTRGTIAEMIPHLKSCNTSSRRLLTCSQCSHCSAKFYDRLLLMLHESREHAHQAKLYNTKINSTNNYGIMLTEQLPEEQCLCGLSFDKICKWNKHTKNCRGTCPFCGIVFAYISVLHKHVLRHNLNSIPHCLHCDMIFKNETRFKEHMLGNRLLSKRLICACGVQMRMLCELETHSCPYKFKIKKKEPPRKCDKCQDVHRDMQKCPAEEQSIYCAYCTDVFQNEHSLAMHQVGNVTERACTRCGVHLESLCSQSMHSELCSATKPTHPCNICKKKFSNKSFLLVHLKRSHNSTSDPMVYGYSCRYKCELCLVTFNKEDSLKQNNTNRPVLQQVDLQDVVIKTEETEQLDCDTEMQTFIDEEAMEFSRISGGRLQANGDASNLDHDDVIKQNVPSKEDGCKKVFEDSLALPTQPWARYKCEVCDKYWNTPRLFIKHNRDIHFSKKHIYMAQTDSNITEITAISVASNSSKHGILIFRCSGCEKIFSTRDTLLEHIQTKNACGNAVIPDIFFCCRYCDVSFISATDLRMHDCTSILYCPCGQCGNPDIMKAHWTKCKQLASTESYCPCRTRGTIAEMIPHFILCDKSHHKILIKCEVCSATFYDRGLLSIHKRANCNITSIQCTYCTEVFESEEKRAIHEDRNRTDDVCPHCDVQLMSVCFQRAHSQVCGAGESQQATVHWCNLCNKKFSSKKFLIAHAMNHIETDDSLEYTYKCEQCLVAFKREDSLKEHNVIYHRKGQTHAAALVKKNPRSLLKELPSTSTTPEFKIIDEPDICEDNLIKSPSNMVTHSVILSDNSLTTDNPTVNEEDHPTFVQQTKYVFRDHLPNSTFIKKYVVNRNKAKITYLKSCRTSATGKVNPISNKQFKTPTNDQEVIQPALNQQTTTIRDQQTKYLIVDQEAVKLTGNRQSTRLSPGEQRTKRTEGIKPIINQETEIPTIEQQIEYPTSDEEDVKPIINQETAIPTIEQQIEILTSDEEDVKPIINQETEIPTNEQQIEILTSDEEDVKPIINQETEIPTIEQQIEHPTSDEEDVKPIINQETEIPTIEQQIENPTADQEDIKPFFNEENEPTSKIRVNIFPSVFSNIMKAAAPIVSDTAVAATVNETSAKVSKVSGDEVYKPAEIIVKTEIKEEPVDDYMEMDIPNEELLIKDDPVESIDDFIANTEEVVHPVVTTSCLNCKEQIEIFSEHKCPLKRFECTVCKTTAVTLTKYTQHYKKHGMHPRQCPACRKIVRRQTLVSHIQSHLTQNYDCPLYEIKNMYTMAPVVRTYTCAVCKEDIQRSDLLSHWERHALKDNVKDNDAKDAAPVRNNAYKIRKTDPLLSSELRKQIQEKLLERRKRSGDCLVCKKSFARRSDLKRHLIEHLVRHAFNSDGFDGMYQCDICNVEIGHDLEEYKRHMREHAGLVLYECKLCNKVFSDSSNFCKHKKVHGIMYMQCDVCKRKFVSRNMLERHMEFHETCTPLVCQECGKVFYFESTLRKHTNNHRAKLEGKLTAANFRCNRCNKRFSSMRCKWDHQWLEHSMRKVEADCPLCDEGYRNTMQLRYHIRTVHLEASLSLQEMRKTKRLKTLDRTRNAIPSRAKMVIKSKVKDEPKSCECEDDSLLRERQNTE